MCFVQNIRRLIISLGGLIADARQNIFSTSSIVPGFFCSPSRVVYRFHYLLVCTGCFNCIFNYFIFRQYLIDFFCFIRQILGVVFNQRIFFDKFIECFIVVVESGVKVVVAYVQRCWQILQLSKAISRNV